VSVLGAYRQLLRNGPLVRLLFGEFVSSIGDWLYLVALLVVVYEASSDPILLGIVGAARVLPYVLLSIPAGIVADRFDRRLILLVTDVARGLIMVALAILVASHGPLAAIVGLAILATCFSTFFGPTIGSYLPSLVRDERELGPANSAWSSLDNLAFVIGPAVAGLLIAVGGLTTAFVLNALSFATIAVVLWRLPSTNSRAAASTAPDGAGAGQVEGSSSEAGSPAPAEPVPGPVRPFPLLPLAGLALIDIAAGFAIGGLGILTVVLATGQLNGGQDATGFLNAAIGVGGLLGAIGSGLVVVRDRLTRPLITGSIIFGGGLVGLGLSTSLAPGLLALAIASAGSLLVEVVSTTLLQRIIPDGSRGRALGVIQTAGILAYAIGAFAMPIIADRFGSAVILDGAAVLIVVAGIVSSILVNLSRDPATDPAMAAVAERVSNLPLFAGIPAFRVATTLVRGTTTLAAPGEVIIRQGDPADRFYVILEGNVEVSQSAQPGEPARFLRRLGPDDAFGELGLLTGSARSANVTALDAVRLLGIDGSLFLELVTAGPELAPRLLALHRGGAVVPVAAVTSSGSLA
jgi:MFS family permease